MHGNRYQVDPALARRRVELVFDPFDLTVLLVRCGGKDAGTATPHHITRHSHPKARPETLPRRRGPPRHRHRLHRPARRAADRQQKEGPVNYRALMPPAAATAARPPPASPAGSRGRGRRGREPARRTAVDDFRQVIDLDQATGDARCALARAAAEAIRGLNWLTRCEAGLGQPSIAYDVIGALALAASRLPQPLTQVTRWLGRALTAGRLGHDLGKDPAAAVDAAAVFLGDARLSAAALAGDLEPPSSSSPSSTARPAAAPGRNRHDRKAPGALRVHPHAVRPRPGPRHAAPPRRPQRGLRPDHLVHQRTLDRRDNRRSRGRQDASRSAPSWPAWTPPGTPSSTCRTP